MLDNPDTIPTAIALRMSFAGKSGITYIPITPKIPPATPTIIGIKLSLMCGIALAPKPIRYVITTIATTVVTDVISIVIFTSIL